MQKVTLHMLDAVPEDALLVAAFPSVGLVATITATYLVEELGLKQVGVMDSPRFPTLSVVENGEPLNPVRIYAGKGLVVFLSEFQPHPELVRPISEALLEFAKEHQCTAIVAPEGLVMEEEPIFEGDLDVFAAASTDQARKDVVKAGATLFQEGIVAGVTGVLLNLGKRDRYPTIGVLSEAEQGQPDGRSASAIIDLIAGLSGVKISTARLHRQADAFEQQMDDIERRVRLQDGHAAEGDSTMFG